MNSCKNWHCCCHTIIPKKRRVVMQYRPPPINMNIPEEDIIATNRNVQQKDATTENEHELNDFESRQVNGADSSSNHSENSDSEFNESAQSGGGSNTNGSELTDIIPKANVDHSESTTSKDEAEPSSETAKNGTASVDEAMDDVKSEDPEETEEIKANEVEETKAGEVEDIKTDCLKEDNVTKESKAVNGITSSEKVKKSPPKEIPKSDEKPKIITEVAVSTPPGTPRGTKRSISEVGVVKDKEQPSTSTGASTGRYNCRNREKFHKCLKCGKMFFQLDTFVRHEKEHLLEETKPCHCNICNRSYTSASSFARHLKTHVSCAQCSKTFSQSEVAKMSSDGNYYCSDCKKNNSSPHPPVLQPESPIKQIEPVVKTPKTPGGPIKQIEPVVKTPKTPGGPIKQIEPVVKTPKTPGGPIKQIEPVVKTSKTPGEHVGASPIPPLKNGAPVFARKSVPVFIPRKNEPVEPPIKKVKTLGAGLQPTVVKNSGSFLRCGKCDKRFPNLTTLKNHQTLHTLI